MNARHAGRRPTDYVPEIDGLRAIAIALVVIYHAIALPRSGFVGVDVFFVISGYLITLLLLRESQTTGRIDLIAFYARRVRRIFPAALLVIIAATLLAQYTLGPGSLQAVVRSAAASALFAGNLYFQAHSGGYWDENSDSQPLLHLWSLAVEEQFYLVWPVLLLVLLRRRAQRLPAIVIAASLASFALTEYLLLTDAQAAFFLTPARFWELAAGGLVAMIAPRRPARSRLGWLGVGLILAGAALPWARFPGAAALPAVVGTALLLYTIHTSPHSSRLAWLRLPSLTWLGRRSYSLYLWHWPLLAIYNATTLGLGSSSARLALCALAVVLAALTFRYVEQPLRHKPPSRRLLVVGLAASVLTAAAALAALPMVHIPPLSAREQWAARVEADMPADWRRCHYLVGSEDFPRAGCASNPAQQPTIVIWGDSLAMSWKPLAWRLAASANRSAIAYSRDACAPLLDHPEPARTPAEKKCRTFNAAVAQRLDGVEMLILAMRLNDKDAAGKIARLRATLDVASPRVDKIVVFGPSPNLPESVVRCIRADDLAACRLPRAVFDEAAQPVLREMRAIAAHYSNVDIVDLSDFLCDREFCAGVRDGAALYLDQYHVTASAAEAFARQRYGLDPRAPPDSP